jgi:histidinol dehydrogenase
MKLLRTQGRRSKDAWRLLGELERRHESTAKKVDVSVRRIVSTVRNGGDDALKKYANDLDGLLPQSPLQITAGELEIAWRDTSESIRDALKVAQANIRKFAERQLPTGWSFSPLPGVTTGQVVRPICAVGCYVPSGRHPLPSSLLMTVVPAQVAGVQRIVVVSPKPARETLAAAHLLGVREFYRIGGAQAIAALAYGTESIAKVDKIVGPGSCYVTNAKRLVAFDCAIDMLAGPTEIVVTSDKGNGVYIAAELVAQAEHDPEALAIFVTTQPALAAQVMEEVKSRIKTNAIAKQSLSEHGYVILAGSLSEARDITNRLAPEHLTVDSAADLAWVTNAGSVFVGDYSPQPMGDYVSGPNHTLPTGGLARVRGGLSVNDFLKLITVQSYTRSGLAELGPAAISLAEAEGLTGHADAIRARGIRSQSRRQRTNAKESAHA